MCRVRTADLFARTVRGADPTTVSPSGRGTPSPDRTVRSADPTAVFARLPGKIVSSAGSTVYPATRHSSSPPPAMTPRSAAPWKSRRVRTETKNAPAAPRHAVLIGGPTCLKTASQTTARVGPAGRLAAVAGQDLDEVVHPDPDQRDQEDDRQQVEPPDRQRRPPERPADADAEAQLGHQRQPERAEHHHQPDEDGRQGDDFRQVRVAVGRPHLVGVQRRPAGRAGAQFGEVAHHLRHARADRVDDLRRAGEGGLVLLRVDTDEQQEPGRVGRVGVGLVVVAQVARGVGVEPRQVRHALAHRQRQPRVGQRPLPTLGQRGDKGGRLGVRHAGGADQVREALHPQPAEEPLERRPPEHPDLQRRVAVPEFRQPREPPGRRHVPRQGGRVFEQQRLRRELVGRHARVDGSDEPRHRLEPRHQRVRSRRPSGGGGRRPGRPGAARRTRRRSPGTFPRTRGNSGRTARPSKTARSGRWRVAAGSTPAPRRRPESPPPRPASAAAG